MLGVINIVTQEGCPKTLKIAQFNAQGLCTKYNDFIDLMCSNDIDVCAKTETYRSDGVTLIGFDSFLQITLVVETLSF